MMLGAQFCISAYIQCRLLASTGANFTVWWLYRKPDSIIRNDTTLCWIGLVLSVCLAVYGRVAGLHQHASLVGYHSTQPAVC